MTKKDNLTITSKRITLEYLPQKILMLFFDFSQHSDAPRSFN